MIDVSVVIINYKLAKFISRHIGSLFSENIKLEIIIVDNSRDDKESCLLQNIAREFPIKVKINPKNIGFGAACNIGTLLSSGEYIFFLNPDAYIREGCIEKLYNFAKKNNIDAVGPCIYLDDKLSIKQPPFYPPIFTTLLMHNMFPRIFSSLWRRHSYNFWRKKEPFKTNFLSGAAFLIKKELARFDERFFLYFEDADLFMRLKKNKKNVYLFPEPKVVHAFDLSPSTLKNSLFLESEQKFYNKHYNKVVPLIKFFKKHKKKYQSPNITPLNEVLKSRPTPFVPLEISMSPEFIPFVFVKQLDYNNLPLFIQNKKHMLLTRKA